MIIHLIKIYCIYVSLMILHETSHFLALKFFRVTILEIVIGNVFFFRFGIVKFSPILFSGSILFSESEFSMLPNRSRVLIYLSGMLSTTFVYLLYYSNNLVSILCLICLLNSILFPLGKSDAFEIIKIVFKKVFKKQ